MMIVTGGAGFIGLNFVKRMAPTSDIVVLDKLTYAGNREALDAVPGVRFVHGDINDRAIVRELFAARPAALVHFAAESHVDRSIDAPDPFITTNIACTFALLEEARRYVAAVPGAPFRFLHISTDEVFGALCDTGAFTERTRYAPRSPYAASKAASDHLVQAYLHTYGLPAIVTNCTNNYGPHQHPEKLIPLMIHHACQGLPLPVYGTGANVRDWIFVEDHCAALQRILERGRLGESYVIGSRTERTNLEVVTAICAILDELRPLARGSYRSLIALVADRPGHDFRYAVDPHKLELELGWAPETRFVEGLRRTVEWYLAVPRST
ncbi:dTDP-glucose 4,6-dehydratase [soil metagenome]